LSTSNKTQDESSKSTKTKKLSIKFNQKAQDYQVLRGFLSKNSEHYYKNQPAYTNTKDTSSKDSSPAHIEEEKNHDKFNTFGEAQ